MPARTPTMLGKAGLVRRALTRPPAKHSHKLPVAPYRALRPVVSPQQSRAERERG